MLPLLMAAAVLSAGQPAPPLTVEPLEGPRTATYSWRALRGKAVVLEFWATWCAPCVEQIPRWNRLVKEFENRPVEFIAITDEEAEPVRDFLTGRPMSGKIVLDPQAETGAAYGVPYVPYTVLVDARGIVRGVTSVGQLGSADIEALIAGRGAALSVRRPQPG